MMERFPYGKAPLWILIMTLVSGAVIMVTRGRKAAATPDLIFATFAPTHVEAYKEALPEFERRHGVKVQLQLVNWQALRGRLQNAMLAGAAVPDLVEISDGSLGFYTSGPLEDVGFVDMTERIRDEGLDTAMVSSRFSLWSSRGRVFAIPHDVHPVMLAYRRDLVEQLGVEVDSLRTWSDFVRVGREITGDLDGDGVPDRYMLDVPGGSWGLRIMLLQRGGGLFDSTGTLILDSEINAETIYWYIHQAEGSDRIFYPCGWGQTLAKSMSDGLVLFYMAPDWRTRQFMMDSPLLTGKMALMPLPAWEEGGRRTSTWGGTGLAITKDSENEELAWKLVKYLYLKKEDLGARFKASHVLPPFKDAWDLPVFSEPSEYYSGGPLGRMYAELAPQVPPSYYTAYSSLAETKLDEAYGNAALYYRRNGDEGLMEYIRAELRRVRKHVRKVMSRNAFADAKSH